MSAIRPDLPSRPFGAAPQAGAPQNTRASAFFRAALGGAAENASAAPQAEAARDTPVRATQTPGAEQRLQRPGSLLNILV